MGFRISNTTKFNYASPQEMYADYKNRGIGGLYAHQSKMIDQYMCNAYDKSDVSLELPTGSGKTLVGLLLGEYRRRKEGEKVLYLCTNKLLVRQVAMQAEAYGIRVCTFIGSKAEYSASAIDAYQSGRAIAVAHYNALFNSNPFFKDPDMLIFDDAHAADECVSSNWTVDIKSDLHEGLYALLCDAIKPVLGDGAYHRLLNDGYTSGTKDWVDCIPAGALRNVATDILREMDLYLDVHNDDIRFPYSMIKGNIQSCNLYASAASISIRPFIPPTQTFSPFSNAKQRLYMSATLGRAGELERSFGVPTITALPMLEDWKGKTTGRRFFVFPLSSFGEYGKDELLIELLKKAGRSLVMVGSNHERERVASLLSGELPRAVFSARDLEEEKSSFLNSDDGIALIANRLDGIDFPDDECRFEVLFDMPEAVGIQERFFVSVAAVRPLYSERMRNRMTQAFGRCARSQNDRSVVCVLDEGSVTRVLASRELKYLNPELQAELKFGHDNAIDLDSLQDYLSLIDEFLANSSEWQPAEEAIISLRDDIVENQSSDDNATLIKLKRSSEYEVLASYALWRFDYEGALREAERAYSCLEDQIELTGFAAYWGFIAASSAYALYKNGNNAEMLQLAKTWMSKSKRSSACTQWLVDLPDLRVDEVGWVEELDLIVEIEKRLQARLSKGHSKARLIKELRSLEREMYQASGVAFEKVHCSLGEWLGYFATNPKGNGEPDPLWISGDSLCIVAEGKVYESDDKVIPVDHVRQAAGHANWVKGKMKSTGDGTLPLMGSAEVITIYITNAKKIDSNAKLQAGGIYYVELGEFRRWASNAVSALIKSIDSYEGEGDSVWRASLCASLKEKSATSHDYIEFVKARKLSSLPTA